MDDNAEHRLPPAPPALLAALRDAETRLDDLDALRAQLRILREALEESPLPTIEDVGARIDTVAISDHGWASDSLTVERVTASGTAEGHISIQGTATGRVDATTDPEVKSWFDKVREVAPAAYKIADLALRAFNTFHGSA